MICLFCDCESETFVRLPRDESQPHMATCAKSGCGHTYEQHSDVVTRRTLNTTGLAMRPIKDYAREAFLAYEKYQAIQRRIDKIEENAGGVYDIRVIDMQLGKGTDYWLYRALLNQRDIQLRIIATNAQMVGVVEEIMTKLPAIVDW